MSEEMVLGVLATGVALVALLAAWGSHSRISLAEGKRLDDEYLAEHGPLLTRTRLPSGAIFTPLSPIKQTQETCYANNESQSVE